MLVRFSRVRSCTDALILVAYVQCQRLRFELAGYMILGICDAGDDLMIDNIDLILSTLFQLCVPDSDAPQAHTHTCSFPFEKIHIHNAKVPIRYSSLVNCSLQLGITMAIF